MKTLSCFMLVPFFLSLAAAAGASQAPTETERAGREAFIALKCTACHRVLGDPGLPKPVAALPAPVLGGLNATHTPEELLTAITKPSHSFAPGFHAAEKGVSRMGDMQDSMTLAQAQSIAAYLKGQEDSDSGWPKESS